MSRWIALLRGVNVGGHNVIKMADLRGALADAGFDSVATYIQSGNIVADTDDTDPESVAQRIGEVINTEFGFTPRLLLMSSADLDQCIDQNPFDDPDLEPKHVHLFFSRHQIDVAEVDTLREFSVPGEEISIGERVLYLNTPDGLGRSKMGAKVDKVLSTDVTARNLRSARAIRDLATPTSS